MSLKFRTVPGLLSTLVKYRQYYAITKTDDVTGILSYSEADGELFFCYCFLVFYLFIFCFNRWTETGNLSTVKLLWTQRTSSKVGNETRSFF